MMREKITLWSKQEYTYPAEGSFVPFLMAYVHEEDEKNEEPRPAMVVVPGGGYVCVASGESEVVALRFYEKGYNAFVLVYTTNPLGGQPLRFQPMKDLSRTVVLIRKQAQRFHIRKDAVTVCGFSAGGHLAASLCVHYDAPELAETGEYAGIPNRPDASILSYAVITTAASAHRGSFVALLGPDAREEDLVYFSLEKQVTADTPPAFLWTTFTDEVVPCENSFLYAEACRVADVPVELHVFSNGRHGLSTADETWVRVGHQRVYPAEQLLEIQQERMDRGLPLLPPLDVLNPVPAGTDLRLAYAELLRSEEHADESDRGLSQWPDLADAWLKKQL